MLFKKILWEATPSKVYIRRNLELYGHSSKSAVVENGLGRYIEGYWK